MKTLLALTFLILPLLAVPESKKVRQLRQQKTELQRKLEKSQKDLKHTKQDLAQKEKSITLLEVQIEDRLSHIERMEVEMDSLDERIACLQHELQVVDSQLVERKDKFRRALQYTRSYHVTQSPLLFILSAKNFTQMYRRARYANEYALYQHQLGLRVMEKQNELLEKQNELLTAKSEMSQKVREVIAQRKALSDQQIRERQQMASLKVHERELSQSMAAQRKQIANLDKKIDDMIAYEIEQARKKAEAERRKKEEAARKKAEAERRRKEEAARKKAEEEARRRAAGKPAPGGTTPAKTTPAKTTPAKTTPAKTTPAKTTPAQTWLTAKELELNGGFEQNKGRLPVPITGSYMVGNKFGVYNVPGLKNVQLDNKGINYVGKTGARARAVYDGEVTAVFQFGGTKNVLIRHGSYISVYCNLSSVIVSKGQHVKARDLIGSVANDGEGNCVLHFQLRKETTKLNPESWIAR